MDITCSQLLFVFAAGELSAFGPLLYQHVALLNSTSTEGRTFCPSSPWFQPTNWVLLTIQILLCLFAPPLLARLLPAPLLHPRSPQALPHPALGTLHSLGAGCSPKLRLDFNHPRPDHVALATGGVALRPLGPLCQLTVDGAFWQHAFLCLFQLLVAVSQLSSRFQHPLPCSHALPTGDTAVTPLRPGREQAGDGMALGHHALLCLGGFCLAHGSISRSHLDHPVPPLHARATAGTALVPLPPLSDKAAAGRAFLIDNTFLSLLSRHFAHGAILRELLHISLPGPGSHPAGDAAGGPGDPVRHHAGGAIFITAAWTHAGLEVLGVWAGHTEVQLSFQHSLPHPLALFTGGGAAG